MFFHANLSKNIRLLVISCLNQDSWLTWRFLQAMIAGNFIQVCDYSAHLKCSIKLSICGKLRWGEFRFFFSKYQNEKMLLVMKSHIEEFISSNYF